MLRLQEHHSILLDPDVRTRADPVTSAWSLVHPECECTVILQAQKLGDVLQNLPSPYCMCLEAETPQTSFM